MSLRTPTFGVRHYGLHSSTSQKVRTGPLLSDLQFRELNQDLARILKTRQKALSTESTGIRLLVCIRLVRRSRHYQLRRLPSKART